jgi:hypothetical protein
MKEPAPDIINQIKATLPSTSHQAFLSSLNTALTLYPDNPAEGSPYDPVGVPTTDRFYGSTNQYKRLASLSGDVFFQSGGFSLAMYL